MNSGQQSLGRQSVPDTYLECTRHIFTCELFLALHGIGIFTAEKRVTYGKWSGGELISLFLFETLMNKS